METKISRIARRAKENPKEVVEMSKANTVAIEKAKEVLNEISEDEHERYLAFLRQKYIMDQKAIEQAFTKKL